MPPKSAGSRPSHPLSEDDFLLLKENGVVSPSLDYDSLLTPVHLTSILRYLESLRRIQEMFLGASQQAGLGERAHKYEAELAFLVEMHAKIQEALNKP